ncbi:unnamed protein product [Caenorhabditis sp. 36 PRJEB53466]|nr:unnamed protein product [Caenorhabditis sp. 36 PRJEB53466]
MTEKEDWTWEHLVMGTACVFITEVTIMWASILIHYFCFFRKRLAAEAEQYSLALQKLERIKQGVPEPDELSPTQLSSLLEADKTQKSDRVNKKKKKKSAEKSKEKKTAAVTKRKTKTKPNVHLSAEKTQKDEMPLQLLSPVSIKSFTDTATELQKQDKVAQVVSDPDQNGAHGLGSVSERTCSLFDEQPVYSPTVTAQAPAAPIPHPRAHSQEPEAEDEKTARD